MGQDPTRFGRRQETKVATAIEPLNVSPQNGTAHPVKRADRNLNIVLQQLPQPGLHLFGSSIRECDAENPAGLDTFGGNSVGDATGDHSRLTAARTCKHKQGAAGMRHRNMLLGIEVGQNLTPAHCIARLLLDNVVGYLADDAEISLAGPAGCNERFQRLNAFLKLLRNVPPV